MRDPGLMVPAGSEATSTLNREPGLEVPDSATEAESMVVEVRLRSRERRFGI